MRRRRGARVRERGARPHAPRLHRYLAIVLRRRALLSSLIAGATIAAAACSGSSGSSGKSTSTSSTSSVSSTTSTTLGAVPPPDLARARIVLTKLATLDDPTALAVRDGDATLYVTEQAGRVRAIRDGRLVEQPVVDLGPEVAHGGERGLLGIAFSPDGTKMYLDYTNTDGDTRVVEYTVAADGSVAPGTRRELLAIPQPQANHNGGDLVVGNDGLLYIAMGDGGGAGDQGIGHAAGGNGQSVDTLLGKILRIDPTPSADKPYTIPSGNPFANGGGRPEIWAYGLRNPWRFSFDRATHDLWIGDVGQDRWEEIDYVQGGNAAGMNFGWNVFEGMHPYRGGSAPNAVEPIAEYGHGPNACSISGGYVYRGTRIPDLVGAYVYADYCGSTLRALTQANGVVRSQRASLGVDISGVVSFGQDDAGELYVLSQKSGLSRIDPA
jgi:glucose/arabinose dehydrogenase